MKQKQNHSADQHEETIYFFYFIFFSLIFLYSLLQFPFLYVWIRNTHPGMVKFYFSLLRINTRINPYILFLLYYLTLLGLNYIKPHKKISIPFLLKFQLSFSLLFLSIPLAVLLPIYYSNSPSFFWLIPFGISLLLPAIGIELLMNAFDTSNLRSQPIFKRFPMNKKYFSNDFSIHWKIHPHFQLNLLNPFRGIGIIGGPGAGKSYTVVEEIIDQLIHKNFTGLIYDFKFPTLSSYAYASWVDAHQNKLNQSKFHVIYFRDVRYSHRCNPLHPTMLTEYAMAGEAATTILLNINRTWAQKQGEFFSDSAIIILTAIIWYLRCKSIELKKDICSLPHVIEFASHADYNKIIDILTEHPEVKNTIVALQSAKRTDAMEQLGGQLGSLQIAMSKLNDKKMLWVMSGNDFTLDINRAGNEQIVILGNDDQFKKIYAPALSLYASMCTGLINQKKRKPCALIIDEFPTIFINNFEQLPATARSNKVACIIAMQDLAQLRDGYGKDKADIIVSTVGNIFIGETSEKNTAQFASELIGKDIITRKSYSNDERSNVNLTEQYDLLIHTHEVQKLNVGEFVGKISEVPENDTNSLFNGSNNETQKIFAGKLLVNKPNHYYCDETKSEFKYKMPKRKPFHNLCAKDESEELAQVDKILTDNIERIRNEINDLILEEFYLNQFKNYLQFTDNVDLKRAYSYYLESNDISLDSNSALLKFISKYIQIAIEEENLIYADPARKKQRASATHHAFNKAIQDLITDNSPSDLPADNQEELDL
jgi:hypothetical protein